MKWNVLQILTHITALLLDIIIESPIGNKTDKHNNTCLGFNGVVLLIIIFIMNAENCVPYLLK